MATGHRYSITITHRMVSHHIGWFTSISFPKMRRKNHLFNNLGVGKK